MRFSKRRGMRRRKSFMPGRRRRVRYAGRGRRRGRRRRSNKITVSRGGIRW